MRIIRLFFVKTREAAYISHLDLQRVMARALRRSGFPAWYTQGFNPHIYMSFALPLPLMQESLCEAVDCKTEQEGDLSSYIPSLNAALPRGIDVMRIAEPVMDASAIAWAEYDVKYPGKEEQVAQAIQTYNSKETVLVTRKTKRSQTEINLKEYLPAVATGNVPDMLVALLPAGGQMNLNPTLLTEYLESECGLPASNANIVRKQVFDVDRKIFC